jgi:hypothetical protein
MTQFTDWQPSLENYWRSIILLARNVASYKFSLGKSLLVFAKQGNEVVTLEQLAEPYARNLREHLRNADSRRADVIRPKSYRDGARWTVVDDLLHEKFDHPQLFTRR